MVYFPLQYLSWHYRYGLPNLFLIAGEFVRFIFNFFSIGLFLRTLFQPMFSVRENIQDQELASDMFSLIVGNLFLRILGFLLRTTLIAAGLAGIALTIVCMAALIVLWIFLPALFFLSIYFLIDMLAK